MRFRMVGERKKASRHFFCSKKWRTKPQGFTSLCEAQLHSKGAAFSSHLHQIPEALLVKTLHFIPLVKRSACTAREVAACRRVDVFLFTALRLHGGKPQGFSSRFLHLAAQAAIAKALHSKGGSLFFTSSPTPEKTYL